MSDETPARTVVLVTGSGRSGTSSLAGTLKRLGLHVPQPEVPAKPSNPLGFYEPQWVIDFHKGHLKALNMHNIDSRPWSVALVAERLADGQAEAELRGWLEEQAVHPQIVVKDPHAFWFESIWRSVCRDLGIELKLLTSLRHPAEVVGSRDLAYLQKQSRELRLVKETANVAGWVHSALLTEKAGRGLDRAFVRYTDLMTDWRQAMVAVAGHLEIAYNADLTAGEPHDVDDFLDADLRRSRLTWDDVTVPADLRDMAEEVWTLLEALLESPADQATMDRLDAIHADYDEMFSAAVGIAFDHTKAEVQTALREADETIVTLRRRLQNQRAQVKELRAQQSAKPRTLRQRIAGRLSS